MTIDKLNMMKLYGMELAFSEQIETPRYNELSFEERFGMITDEEMGYRENRRLKNLSTQFPVEKWHDNIGDPTVADAICDRLIHNSHRIKLTGESMRKKYSDL